MSTLVLFVSKNKLTEEHFPVSVGKHTLFVRGQSAPGDLDTCDALDAATPLRGEILLNAISTDELSND